MLINRELIFQILKVRIIILIVDSTPNLHDIIQSMSRYDVIPDILLHSYWDMA